MGWDLIKLLVYRDTSRQKTGEGSFPPWQLTRTPLLNHTRFLWLHTSIQGPRTLWDWYLLMIKTALKTNPAVLKLRLGRSWEQDTGHTGVPSPGNKSCQSSGEVLTWLCAAKFQPKTFKYTQATSLTPQPETRCCNSQQHEGASVCQV